MYGLGGLEWVILLVICIVPLVLAGILVGLVVWNARTRATTTRKCPYCAETIKAEAILCRFCGRDIPPKQSLTDG